MEDKSRNIISIGISSNNAFFGAGLETVISENEGFKIGFTTLSQDSLLNHLSDLKGLNILLLDVNVHQKKEQSVIAGIKDKLPQLKIVVLSKLDHPYNIVRAFYSGADGHIAKNADAKTLRRALLSVYYTGTYYNETVLRKRPDLNTAEKLIITERELRLLNLFCTELGTAEIEQITGYNKAIVEGYYQILCEKLNVHSREGIIVTAYKIGIISKPRFEYQGVAEGSTT